MIQNINTSMIWFLTFGYPERISRQKLRGLKGDTKQRYQTLVQESDYLITHVQNTRGNQKQN